MNSIKTIKVRNGLFSLVCICLLNCHEGDNDLVEKETDSNLSDKIDTTGIKSFKGWELYSWYDKEWKFVLLEGTNRNKSVKEIATSEKRIDGEAELERAISKLHKGEMIVWMDGSRLEPDQAFRINFQKPPGPIVDRVSEVCKRKEIELVNAGN